MVASVALPQLPIHENVVGRPLYTPPCHQDEHGGEGQANEKENPHPEEPEAAVLGDCPTQGYPLWVFRGL